jgi:hypothetical protein
MLRSALMSVASQVWDGVEVFAAFTPQQRKMVTRSLTDAANALSEPRITINLQA